MTDSARCPALFVTAPASGQGKTTVTAALARLHARRGRKVRVFKCGPDFLDPMILEAASGAPVHNLDLWMTGAADADARLYAAAQEADLILVEGVMGLFDGTPSGADVARRFGLPLLTVIDGSAMAQTFGALVHGLTHYQPGLICAGALANKVGSEGHAALLKESLPPGVAWFGRLPPDADAALPERHLGILQAAEIGDLMTRLDRMADALEASAGSALPPPVAFPAAAMPLVTPVLAGVKVAVARDAAFAFAYPANLETLARLGAEVRYFSPLADDALPECDAAWLPGGYPELHAGRLAANASMLESLRSHVAAGKPMLAECGGMMALFDTLADQDGREHALVGCLPGRVVMQQRLAALGLQQADLGRGPLRGHTFHYSRVETSRPAEVQAVTSGGRQGEAVWCEKRLTASYVHFYFPSNPEGAAALFKP